MNKVVQLISVRQERQLSLEEAWDRFVAANLKAKDTLKIEDGIAASKAYREFLDLADRKGA